MEFVEKGVKKSKLDVSDCALRANVFKPCHKLRFLLVVHIVIAAGMKQTFCQEKPKLAGK